MLDVILKILDKLQSVLLVVSGSAITLFVPLVKAVIRKRNRKKDVKYELIAAVYQYYSIRKRQLIEITYQSFFACRISLLFNKLNQGNLNAIQIGQTKDMIKLFDEQEKTQSARSIISHGELVKIESKCISLLAEIQHHYKSDSYKDINHLVLKAIREGNSPTSASLHKYQDKTEDELDAIGLVLPDQLTVKEAELQKELDDSIADITAIL